MKLEEFTRECQRILATEGNIDVCVDENGDIITVSTIEVSGDPKDPYMLILNSLQY